MAKDPAFLFYPNDYIGGTMGMTFEQKGAYIELLMLQFNRGHMDGHMIGQTVGQIWDEIKDKFVQDEKGLWFNERLDNEKNVRKAYTQSRRNNLSGKNQYTKDQKKVGHMTSHMENEDEDVNKDDRKGGLGEKQKYDESVTMTNVEMSTLIERFGINATNWMIDKLNNYKISKGKKYKSDYRAILSWVVKEWKKEKSDDSKVDSAILLQQDYGIHQ